jgi:hypothetical protein
MVEPCCSYVTAGRFSLESVMTFLRIVIPLYLFDLNMIFAQTRSTFVAREKPVPTFPDHALAPTLLPVTGRAATAPPADLAAAAPTKRSIAVSTAPTMPVAASALYFDHIGVDLGAVQRWMSQRQRCCGRKKGDWHCERHSQK